MSAYAQDLLPSVPEGLETAVPYLSGTLYLYWEENEEFDIEGYRIYRGEESGGIESKEYIKTVKKGEGTRYTDEGLENGKRYYYQVKAYDWRGNESKGSEEVSGIPREPEYGGTVKVDFGKYRGYNEIISDFEEGEFWSKGTYDRIRYKTGESSLKISVVSGGTEVTESRFGTFALLVFFLIIMLSLMLSARGGRYG